MTGTELQTQAAALNVNPYFLGYALATGADSIEAARKRDGGNHEYMIWNGRRWNEVADRCGVARDMIQAAIPDHVEKFCELAAEHIDAFDWSWAR